MKILVIGNGFIGASIIQHLESEGHELLIFSRSFNEKIRSNQVLIDILEYQDFKRMLSWKPQIVIHTAWVTRQGIYQNDPTNYKYAKFTVELAKHISYTGIERLIVLGSCAEYGLQTNPSTAGVTKLSPHNLYGEQKVAAFYAIKNLLEGSKIQFTWARIFQPYGPMQDINRLIPYLIRSIKNGHRVSLSDTSSIHDWVTTRDIASAITWIINHKLNSEVDIGTSIGHSNLDIVNQLEELLQEKIYWEELPQESSEAKQVSVSGKDSPLFLSGWTPRDSLKDGLSWVISS